MFEKNAVDPEMLKLIKEIQSSSLFGNHILAGGTALAFQIGHRTSTDIDLFTSIMQNAISIIEYFKKNYKNIIVDIAQDDFTRIYVNNIKIELIYDNEKLIENPKNKENIRFFGINEISAMKIRAIQGRTEARDFIDLAYLLQEMPLKKMFEKYKEKYGSISETMVKRTILTKCKSIKDDEWLVGIKMLRNDIKPKDVLKCIENGIEDYNNNKKIGKAVYD